MVLDLVVTPKMFFTASTDLSARSWVYDFDECVKIFKGHQHSVSRAQRESMSADFTNTRSRSFSGPSCLLYTSDAADE